MKDIGEGTIRRIDWTELTPVVLLLRVFNVALGVRVLAIALLGTCLTVLLGSLLSGVPLPGQACQMTDERFSRVGMVIDFVVRYDSYDAIRTTRPNALAFPPMPIVVSFDDALNPCNTLIPYWTHTKLFLWLPGVFLIWVFCGGMICRIVALRLTVDESESTSTLFLFFRKRGIGYISSLIILSLGILCCFLPVLIAYWLATVPGVNYVVAILLPIPLLFALFTVILALGLAVGWMLLFAAVSTDGSDGFDAISRMFSYIFQRPLHYILYWICSGILGCLGYLFVFFISSCVVGMADAIASGDSTGIAAFWVGLIWLLPTAYAFAWFWTSSVAIYLLLRRSVDATPLTEVYRVVPPKVRTLPVIQQDERGAPEIKQTEPQA